MRVPGRLGGAGAGYQVALSQTVEFADAGAEGVNAVECKVVGEERVAQT